MAAVTLPEPGKERIAFPETLTVFILSYIFLLLSRVENFSAAHDSITYLNAIREGKDLYHPHHLLYHPLAREWMLFWKQVFPQSQDFYLIEAFTSLWGAAFLSLSYKIFRAKFTMSPGNAVSGIAVLGFSYGIWFYSVNIEVYMPSVFFMTLLLYSIPEKLTGRGVVKLSLIHSLAILFHQVNILFLPVMIGIFYLKRKDIHILRSLMIYAVIGSLICVGMYFYGGWLVEEKDSFVEWFNWLLGYTRGHDFWRPWNSGTVLAMFTGIAHAFIGGHFLFQIPEVKNYLSRSLQEHSLNDELFLSSAISPWLAWTLLILSFLLCVLTVILLIRAFRNRKILWENPSRNFVVAAIFTIIVYSFFFSFWMPEILEFWILQIGLFWILLIGIANRQSSNSSKVSSFLLQCALAAVLFCINYFGSMKWLQRKDFDWYRVQAEHVIPHLTPGTSLILEKPWIQDEYFRYLAKTEIFDLEELMRHPDLVGNLPPGRLFLIHERDIPEKTALENLLNRKFTKERLYLPGNDVLYILE